MISILKSHQNLKTEADIIHKAAKNSELALIEILAEYHDRINLITDAQATGLKNTSSDLEQASQKFLQDLRDLFETEKTSSSYTPFFKSLEYIASFMTIALGVGLCSTGVASLVGSVMITTGLFGCLHTSLELSGAYKHLSKLTDDRRSQEIIKDYLPAMIATTLALSASITGAYSATVALNTTMNTVRLFLPLIIQSLQTSQVIAKGVFDLHRHKAESRKIDHEALKQCLETILDEQHSAMMSHLGSQSKLNKDAIRTLKLLTSLHKHL